MLLIYRTQADAYASLAEFTPGLAARHSVIVATRNGYKVGWIRVLHVRKGRRVR